MIITKDSVIFNNTKGEIISLNKFDGNLNWLTPTVEYGESLQSFLVKNLRSFSLYSNFKGK